MTEHEMLLAIKDAVSDYFCGKKYPEFAKENGGMLNLEVAMKIKLEYWEEKFNTEKTNE